jgi:hypothetical protein
VDKFKLSITGIIGFMLIAIVFNQSSIFWLFFFLSIFCIPLAISIAKQDTNAHRQKLIKSFKESIEKNSITPTQQFLSDDLTNGIVLDEEKSKIALLYNEEESYNVVRFNFDKIIEIEVNQDGDTITKISKGNVIGGALVGSVLAGGVGALLGGLTTSKTSTEKVKNLNIRIIFNELSTPVFTVNFLNFQASLSKDDERYKKAIKDIDHWYGIFSVLLKRNEETKQNIISS